jgi:hypothetical protein
MAGREDLANIAERGAHVARGLGSSRAWPSSASRPSAIRDPSGRRRCTRRRRSWTSGAWISSIEGEMTVDVALNPAAQRLYPFCRLTGPANILVVPARHSASISTKLMQEMAGATVIGPILPGSTSRSRSVRPRVDGERYPQHGGARGLRDRAHLSASAARTHPCTYARAYADVGRATRKAPLNFGGHCRHGRVGLSSPDRPRTCLTLSKKPLGVGVVRRAADFFEFAQQLFLLSGSGSPGFRPPVR